jgi:hypothetical protein
VETAIDMKSSSLAQEASLTDRSRGAAADRAEQLLEVRSIFQ